MRFRVSGLVFRLWDLWYTADDEADEAEDEEGDVNECGTYKPVKARFGPWLPG